MLAPGFCLKLLVGTNCSENDLLSVPPTAQPTDITASLTSTGAESSEVKSAQVCIYLDRATGTQQGGK